MKTVWIVTTDPYAGMGVHQYLLDGMQGFDPQTYRDAIRDEGIDAVAEQDWRECWTQGETTFDSEDDAVEYQREHYNQRPYVVTVTLDDVKAALLAAFGP